MTLKVHHLRPAPGAKRQDPRRSRRGVQGQDGRPRHQGHQGPLPGARPRFEGGQMPLHMRLPKLKGFKNPFRVEYQVVNLGRLAELFPDGGAVGRRRPGRSGAVRKGEPVKVLGDGDLAVSLQVTAHAFSGSARTRSPPPAARPPQL